MATNTKVTSNGRTYEYYRITRTVGHKYDENGVKRPIKKQFTGSSKAAAERKYNEWLMNQKSSIVDRLQTFGELSNYYANEVLGMDSKYAYGTKRNYLASYDKYVKNSSLKEIPMSKIRPEDIQVFYNGLDVTHEVMRGVNKFMTVFIKWANQNKYTDCNLEAVIIPTKRVVTHQEGIVTWTDEEIDKIFNGEPDYMYMGLILFAYYTGMRVSELFGLKWEDIDENVIHVRRQYYRDRFGPTKNKKTRDIPMHEKIKDYVRTADKPYELVFCGVHGTPLVYTNVVRSLRKYYRRIDVTPKKFHAYRATFVTRLCANGVPIQIASKMAGHSNINVTAQYYASIEMSSMMDAIGKI